MSRRRRIRLRACAALALLIAASSCGDDAEPQGTPGAASNEVLVARELAAAHFAGGNTAKTREILAPLAARADAAVEDLVAAAIVELQLADVAKAKLLLERAAQRAPDDAAANYNLGRLAELQGDLATAAKFFERALRAAPGDAPTKLHLAGAVEDSDPARALQLLRELVALGVDQLGPWYRAAVYRLAMSLRAQPDGEAESVRLLAEALELDGRGIKSPSGPDFDMGNLGRIARPAPRGNSPSGTGVLPAFADAQTILPELAGATRLSASDLDNDGRLDLVACGPQGLSIGLQRAGFAWEARKLADGRLDRAIAFDLGNDDDMDLLFARDSELGLLEGVKEGDLQSLTWRAWPGKLPALPSAALDLLAIDFDHEGDLDLLVVGAFGARLLRNDGAAIPDKGAFTDVTAEAGLPRERAFAWCLAEDFDTDQDVDLLLGGAQGTYLASNLRGGVFEDRSAWLADLPASAVEPVVADFDGDARPDVWSSAGGGRLLRGQPSGRLALVADFALAPLPDSVAPEAARACSVLDYDLDGAPDLLWSGAAPGGELHQRVQLVPASPLRMGVDGPLAAGASASLLDDVDGDFAWDQLAVTPRGVVVLRGKPGQNHAARLGFRGKKDNRRGVGAVIELRAGPIYRRIFWRGESELVGVGAQTEIDYVRVTWPNGAVQYETSRNLGDRAATKDALGLLQSDALQGSCPFLYAWNGSKYEFVTDVIGITPLGLPMAPGMLVPPDHDEYVLVRGDQLQAKDGFYELQITEELREVTYLDRIRLDVVDSPVGVEIYPNELFCFPPFPQAHTHTVRAPHAPRRALGSDGGDWTRALAAIDDDYAAPFTPVELQFKGLANPHWLELEFDPRALAGATKLRLVMTGWFFWTDASVNMAAARDPEHEFVPPILQLPDGNGGWKDAGPPIGFPAGKTKSMVVDVSGLLARDDPRLRLFSTLRLYWDSIRLAVDADDAPLETRSLEAASATLWRRGFSAPIASPRPHQPERFEWHELAQFPRWNQHPGLYTRYGETSPLLAHVDDRLVILGAGDALTVRFDARALPPPREGFKRDFLVFLDGWAKDRDPNTVEALYVEPLPFHGMSGYPYGPDERFPDTPEHRAWRREWNTREARAWIEPLCVAR